MTDFRRICCPTDFSEASREALREGSQLARRYGAGLTVLHVAEPVHGGPEMAFAAAAQQIEEAAASSLSAWKTEAERMLGGQVGSVLVAGPPAPAIVRFARDSGTDLIVMASHGRTGIRRLVLGSVAEQVLRSAPCDVLVVRREEVNRSEETTDTEVGMPA
jgi:nucleotide-binding universal stress UspA family protein